MLSKRILCSLVFALCGGLVSAEDIVFLENSMVKIPRDADLEVSRKSSFHLNASRNEHELFQVVVRPDCNTAMVTVAVSSLEDNAGNKIASDSISVYNAHYLTHENQISYPDALPRHTAIPVRKNTNQSFYVDLYIPESQKTGKYTGHVKVSVDGRIYRCPLSITVYPLSLPKKPSVHSAFLLWHVQRQICGYYGISTDSSEYKALRERLYWFLVSRRLMPSELPVSLMSADALKYLKHPQVKTYCLGWIPRSELLKEICERMRKNGVLENGFVYAWDEPKDTDIPKYKEYYEKAKKAVPEAMFLLTDNHNHLPLLTDYVDILCPGIATYDPEFFQREQKRGKRVWWYTCNIPTAPYPTYHITDDGIAPRILSWLQAKYQIEGSLYWSTILWTKVTANGTEKLDVWNKTTKLASGDGLLIYPPEKITDEPVTSLRLELIRQGNEDLDLLNMLRSELLCTAKKMYLEYSADKRIFSIVNRIASTRVTYTRNTQLLEDVRKEVLDELAMLKHGPTALLYASQPEGILRAGTQVDFTLTTEKGCRVRINPGCTYRRNKNSFTFSLPIQAGKQQITAVVEKDGRKSVLKRSYFGTTAEDTIKILLSAENLKIVDMANCYLTDIKKHSEGMQINFAAGDWALATFPVNEKACARYSWIKVTLKNPEQVRVTASLLMYSKRSRSEPFSFGSFNVDAGKERSFVFPFNSLDTKTDERIDMIRFCTRPMQTPRTLIIKDITLHTELPNSGNMK